MSNTLSVSESVMNKVLAVLSKLPFDQVAGLINELQQDVAANNAAPTPPETPPEE